MIKKILFSIAILFAGLISVAQIPSPKDFLGYEPGEHFTPHYKIVQYFKEVAKSSTYNVRLEQYGLTNGGRPLLLAFISAPENISNLENIRLNNLRLAGLEKGSAELSNPKAIVWLSYNVHGNEPSSSEAAMLTLYQLITDASSKNWLNNTIVVIDPCLNPDGRDRYVSWFNSVVGQTPNPDPQSREHSEPWPGGRTNYYNFDLNRDWAWQTQVETQQRIKQYNKWMPQVHCDYHEQGYNEPYYFAPAAEPFHEVITPWQREFQTIIGKNHAKYFDAKGWLYFTKERFDLFYPSYGDTWPIYNGSIGMTYEQGGHSRAGLAVINENGDTLTLKDRIQHHVATAMSTIEVSSKNAEKLIENFKMFFDNTIQKGAGDYKTYIIKKDDNDYEIKNIMHLLDNNGIAYGTASGNILKGYNYSTGNEEKFEIQKGDLIISSFQPKGIMVKVLFEPKSKLSDSVTYDITAWSIPYIFGIKAYASRDKIEIQPIIFTDSILSKPNNTYGFVSKWNSFQNAKFLSELIQKGVKVRVAQKPFTINGKNYERGSLIIIKASNQKIENFEQTVFNISKNNNIYIDAVNTGFADKGVDFGSADVKMLRAPRIACLTGEGVNSLAAGEIWFYFEKELCYPVSMINLNDVNRLDLRSFDILIAPDGYYKNLFYREGALKNWVQQGGKLIVLENAANQLAEADWGIKIKKNDDEKDKEKDEYVELKKYANAERESIKESNPGSIFKVELDNTHPLAFGYPNYYYTLKHDNNIYEFMKEGWNVGVIKKDNQIAGFAGVKAKEKLKDGTLIGHMDVGSGAVIFFADNPLFRDFWQNGKLLFANAIFMVSQNAGFHL